MDNIRLSGLDNTSDAEYSDGDIAVIVATKAIAESCSFEALKDESAQLEDKELRDWEKLCKELSTDWTEPFGLSLQRPDEETTEMNISFKMPTKRLIEEVLKPRHFETEWRRRFHAKRKSQELRDQAKGYRANSAAMAYKKSKKIPFKDLPHEEKLRIVNNYQTDLSRGLVG